MDNRIEMTDHVLSSIEFYSEDIEECLDYMYDEAKHGGELVETRYQREITEAFGMSVVDNP